MSISKYVFLSAARAVLQEDYLRDGLSFKLLYGGDQRTSSVVQVPLWEGDAAPDSPGSDHDWDLRATEEFSREPYEVLGFESESHPAETPFQISVRAQRYLKALRRMLDAHPRMRRQVADLSAYIQKHRHSSFEFDDDLKLACSSFSELLCKSGIIGQPLMNRAAKAMRATSERNRRKALRNARAVTSTITSFL